MEAWSGTVINQLPELDIPVTDLNGLMCVPPSEPSGYGNNGFDPVTGFKSIWF